MRYVLFFCAALAIIGMMGLNGYLPLTPNKGLHGKAAQLAGGLCLALAGIAGALATAL
ncbi:MAG: hypothetical protein WD768_20040 [Phycisphaeraceae bacterium]